MDEPLDEALLLLNKIAVHVYNGVYGLFLVTMADTWLTADADNKRILRPAWVIIIDKYNLAYEVEA